MHTVAIISQKGGAGKTTVALHLALAFATSGRNTAVVDLDPQTSAANWGDRHEAELPVVISADASRLQQEMLRARDAVATSLSSTRRCTPTEPPSTLLRRRTSSSCPAGPPSSTSRPSPRRLSSSRLSASRPTPSSTRPRHKVTKPESRRGPRRTERPGLSHMVGKPRSERPDRSGDRPQRQGRSGNCTVA